MAGDDDPFVCDVTFISNKWQIEAKRVITHDDLEEKLFSNRDLNPKDIPRDILEAIHDFVVRGLE